MKLLLASSNAGKLREYQSLSAGSAIQLEDLPNIDSLPKFDETAPTFAENALGKALHFSQFSDCPVLADDSGLVVPALAGAPGVNSARYAGPNASDSDRIVKLLEDLRSKNVTDRRARFVCVIAVARKGDAIAVVSDLVEGVLIDSPAGTSGFGYDPIFVYEPLGKTFGEIPREEKSKFSHRGRAFRKLLASLQS